MRSKPVVWFETAAWFALAAWSLEILLRRWLWHQYPTQVSAVWIYAILVVNALALYRLRPFFRAPSATLR